MNPFILLTRKDGEQVFLNINNIVSFAPGEPGSVAIQLANGGFLAVRESVAEILKRIDAQILDDEDGGILLEQIGRREPNPLNPPP